MTNLSFAKLDDCFRNNDFTSIEDDNNGIRYLKLRSMSRKETMEEFCKNNSINIEKTLSKEYFKLVFNSSSISENDIEDFINSQYSIERKMRKKSEVDLIDQLCRLPYFDWGGSFGNSLEKNIVDNYVKKIKSYKKIIEEVEGSLLVSLRGYTLNSWYNHWTSIIIEDIFKDHKAVLPTVGLVKKIDFFIANIPFDLKVTYFPQELMSNKLQIEGYKKELEDLTSICTNLKVKTQKNTNIKAAIQSIKELLKNYQQEITDYIKVEKNNIKALKTKCKNLEIPIDNELNDKDLKKEVLANLRAFRDKIKADVSLVKYQTELSKLKSKCEELSISVPEDLGSKALEQHLYNKILEDQSKEAKDFIKKIKTVKKKIINEAESNPLELKKWLYENQGEARFDASNRFFLILTDENEIYNSWKLKRSINFLRKNINKHLDTISKRTKDLNTEFYWKKDKKTYQCKSDILFLKYSD